MSEKKTIDDNTIAYLQMIQGNIERMSTSSAIFKGFAATIVAGIATISFQEVSSWILGMSFIPVLSFVLLDLYYLRLERSYRFLYENVRKGKSEDYFSLKLMKMSASEKKISRTRVRDLIKSPSFYLFYPMLIVIEIVVMIMKIKAGA
ncbi:MAG: hypothetical protein PHY47_10205 [Lachnospiraceae bacterium]|nr:hypothetical protein [Lachnospiraceae bacterium]